jgi:rhodanese-related sulfurtransferase
MRRGIIRDVAIYLVAAVALGTAANFVPSRHLPFWGQGQLPPTEGTDFQWLDVSSAEALSTSLPNVIFLDSRGPEASSVARVPGARQLLLTEIGDALTPELESDLRNADAVIIYGETEDADVEQLLGQALRSRGLAPPFILIGGFQAWDQAGLPVDGGGQ